MPKHILN